MAARRGFILLEVVITVGLLVMGMAVIGAQIQRSAYRAHATNRLARVVFLAESKIAELDTNLIEPEREQEEDFGRLFPDYAWRMRIEPSAIEDFVVIQLEILHHVREDVDDDFNFDDAKVLEVYHTLRLVPRPLDLTTDFGMEDDVADQLAESLPNLSDGPFDPRNIDPSFIVDRDIEEILEILLALLEASGTNAMALMSLVPPDMQPLLQSALQQQAQQAADDASTEGNQELETESDQSEPGDGEPDLDENVEQRFDEPEQERGVEPAPSDGPGDKEDEEAIRGGRGERRGPGRGQRGGRGAGRGGQKP